MDFVTRYFTGFRIRVNCGQWIIVLCRKFAGVPYFAEQRERSTSERTEADPYVHGKTLVATDFNGSETALSRECMWGSINKEFIVVPFVICSSTTKRCAVVPCVISHL